jgi:hypothetical protein
MTEAERIHRKTWGRPALPEDQRRDKRVIARLTPDLAARFDALCKALDRSQREVIELSILALEREVGDAPTICHCFDATGVVFGPHRRGPTCLTGATVDP